MIRIINEGQLWGEDEDSEEYEEKIYNKMLKWIDEFVKEMKLNGFKCDLTYKNCGHYTFSKNGYSLEYNDNIDKVGMAVIEFEDENFAEYVGKRLSKKSSSIDYEGDNYINFDFAWVSSVTTPSYTASIINDYVS